MNVSFCRLMIVFIFFMLVIIFPIYLLKSLDQIKGNAQFGTQDGINEIFERKMSIFKYENLPKERIKCREKKFNNKDPVLIPRRMATNISPEDNIFPKCGYKNLLTPKVIDEGVWMLFIIKSAPSNFILRQTLRQTWAAVSQMQGKKLRTLFLLGTTENPELAKSLEKENDEHHDTLQCDVLDSYHNLTEKVFGSFQWILENKIKAKYYSYGDDDIVVNIGMMYLFFERYEMKKLDSMVCLFKLSPNSKPSRDPHSKWNISKKNYDLNYYPTFCHGALYTITLGLLRDIYCTAKSTNYTGFYMDDVLITGILRYKASGSNDNIMDNVLDEYNHEVVFYWWNDQDANRHLKLEHIWKEVWKKYTLSDGLKRLQISITKEINRMQIKSQNFTTQETYEEFSRINKDY